MTDDAPRIADVQLLFPQDAHRYYVGQQLCFVSRPRWYVRLWRWIRRGFRRELPTVLTVTAIDYENGVVTVDSARADA